MLCPCHAASGSSHDTLHRFAFQFLAINGNFGNLFCSPTPLFFTFVENKGQTANRPLGDPGVTLGWPMGDAGVTQA